MLKGFLLIAVLAFALAEDPEVKVEEGVLVLTEANFDSVIESTDYILVEFYAPWCGHCKNLAPEYAKAAQALAEKESPVKLAKVDATEEKALGTRFGVRGFPTLKFFIKGTPVEYGGGRTKDTIVTWVTKKSGPPAASILSKEDAEKLLENNVAVIGFFEDDKSDAAQAFIKVAMMNDDYMFGFCTDAEIMKAYEMEKHGLALFKKFDEKRADLTEDLTYENMNTFVSTKAVPLFVEFTSEVSQKLFANKEVPFMFVAMSKQSDAFEKAEEVFTSIAKENQGKLKVVLLNTDNSAGNQVLKYLDIKSEDYPTYKILNLEKGLKYKPEESDLSSEKVNAFVSAFLSGELKPFLKSAEVPEDWDAENVKVLVGKNFKEVALDDSKHVFVEFYAPWCGHCKKLAPIWDELAEKYAESDDVVIAKMDSTLNEVEEVTIKGYPTLKFFPANSDGKIVDFNGERTLDGFLSFLGKYAKPPTKEEEAPETPEEVKEEVKEEKKKDEL